MLDRGFEDAGHAQSEAAKIEEYPGSRIQFQTLATGAKALVELTCTIERAGEALVHVSRERIGRLVDPRMRDRLGGSIRETREFAVARMLHGDARTERERLSIGLLRLIEPPSKVQHLCQRSMRVGERRIQFHRQA